MRRRLLAAAAAALYAGALHAVAASAGILLDIGTFHDFSRKRRNAVERRLGRGFSMKQIEALLALWSDGHRASSEVKILAQAHATELGERIREMQAMQRTLIDLSKHCRGNQRPDCPILDDLAVEDPHGS